MKLRFSESGLRTSLLLLLVSMMHFSCKTTNQAGGASSAVKADQDLWGLCMAMANNQTYDAETCEDMNPNRDMLRACTRLLDNYYDRKDCLGFPATVGLQGQERLVISLLNNCKILFPNRYDLHSCLKFSLNVSKEEYDACSEVSRGLYDLQDCLNQIRADDRQSTPDRIRACNRYRKSGSIYDYKGCMTEVLANQLNVKAIAACMDFGDDYYERTNNCLKVAKGLSLRGIARCSDRRTYKDQWSRQDCIKSPSQAGDGSETRDGSSPLSADAWKQTWGAGGGTSPGGGSGNGNGGSGSGGPVTYDLQGRNLVAQIGGRYCPLAGNVMNISHTHAKDGSALVLIDDEDGVYELARLDATQGCPAANAVRISQLDNDVQEFKIVSKGDGPIFKVTLGRDGTLRLWGNRSTKLHEFQGVQDFKVLDCFGSGKAFSTSLVLAEQGGKVLQINNENYANPREINGTFDRLSPPPCQ